MQAGTLFNSPNSPHGQPLVITGPTVLLFLMIAVLPIGMMLGQSMVVEGHLTLDHYLAVFSEMRVWVLFLKSLALATGATLLSLLFGVPLAILLARADFPGRKIATFLYLVPLFIPPHIHALAWIYLLGEKGVLTIRIMDLLHLQTPLFNLYGATGSAIILFLSYFPILVLLTLTGFAGMDQRLEEAARFHHKPLTVQRKIILPLISPYILSGTVFVFIFSFFNYGVPSMLRVPSFPVEIFTRFSAFYDEAGATALSAPLVAVALLLLFVQARYMKNRAYVTISTASRGSLATTLSGRARFSILYVFILLLIAVLLPLCALILQAGPWTSYQAAFRTSWRELLTTLGIAALAATVSAALAFFLARSIGEIRSRRQKTLEVLTFLPFAFPASLFGIGLIHLWNNSATGVIYTSFCILVIAYVARFVPFAIRVMSARLKQISPSLQEAAYLCEPNWWKRFFFIEFPLARQGLVIAWIITFIFSMGELGATLLVIPPGQGTVSLKVYTLMHYGAGPLVAALALILITVNLLVSSGMLISLNHKQP